MTVGRAEPSPERTALVAEIRDAVASLAQLGARQRQLRAHLQGLLQNARDGGVLSAAQYRKLVKELKPPFFSGAR